MTMAPVDRFGTNWERPTGANAAIRCAATDRGRAVSVSDTETRNRTDAHVTARKRTQAHETRMNANDAVRIRAHRCASVRIRAHRGFGTNWEHGRTGGTGRRGGLKSRWGASPCGFDSRVRHRWGPPTVGGRP